MIAWMILSSALLLQAEKYYKEQEHAKAFDTFLKSLAATPQSSVVPMTPEEEKLYNEGMALYLDPKERDREQLSMKIRDRYGGVWRLHPEYSHIGYLVAIAYANLGNFPEFFEIFYQSYKKIPNHYLNYKTQAILHIKLYDLARSLEEKQTERKLALQAIKKAKELYPKDFSLYKMEIAFSNNKEQVLEENLKEIIDKDIVIPRADLSFYFDQLLAQGKDALASEFLEKARQWYPYSRTLDAASEMIKPDKVKPEKIKEEG